MGNGNVGAVIYIYDGEFRSLEQLKRQMFTWQAEIQVVVCKRLERSVDWSEDLYHFCANEQIELVELDPDAETIEELNECHELYGVPRVRQILETGNWNGKVMKTNPLESNGQRSVEEIGLPVNNSVRKSPEDSFDDVEFGCGDYDMTDEDKEMILKLFGGAKVSFDNLVKDVDVPDPAVIEYFKQEAEKLRRQNKTAANVTAANEFGEFVGAGNSTQITGNVVTQDSSCTGSPYSEHVDVDADMHGMNEKKVAQDSKSGNFEDYRENSKQNSPQLSDGTRSMIDKLLEGSNDEGTSLANKIQAARSALLKMPFGPERQNLAADTMVAVIKSIGDSDLFNSSSDEESHGQNA
uniref:Uncharacterized protein n=1 Tax=Setaria digitata TaxID=48799 RepID=A0A915PQ78_9BILA